MAEDLYESRLASFKENEKPEAVLLVSDDPDLVKIVVSWGSVGVRRSTRLRPLRDDSESHVWDWLWRNTTYSYEGFEAKSSVPAYVFRSKMPPLIRNRILYPDGTVHSFVQRYLRDRVRKLFDVKLKQSARQPRP